MEDIILNVRKSVWPLSYIYNVHVFEKKIDMGNLLSRELFNRTMNYLKFKFF